MFWVGLSKWIGGHEGDHTEIVVGETQQEVVDALFTSFEDVSLVDWNGTIWDKNTFVKKGCQFFGEEGVVIVKEVTLGELAKFTPRD